MNKKMILSLILISLIIILPVSALSFSDAITGFIIKPITNLFTGRQASLLITGKIPYDKDDPIHKPPEGAFKWKKVEVKGKCVENPQLPEVCSYHKNNQHGAKDYEEKVEDCDIEMVGLRFYCKIKTTQGKIEVKRKLCFWVPIHIALTATLLEDMIREKEGSHCNTANGEFMTGGGEYCNPDEPKPSGQRKSCTYKLQVGCWDSDAYVGSLQRQQFYKGHIISKSIGNDKKQKIDKRWDASKRGTKHERIYEHTCNLGGIASHKVGCPGKETNGVCKCSSDSQCSETGTYAKCINGFCEWIGKKPEGSVCQEDSECISNLCEYEDVSSTYGKCTSIPDKDEIKDEIKQELDIPDKDEIKDEIKQDQSFKDEIKEEILNEIPLCTGCNYNGNCVPIGFRRGDLYCPETGGDFENQLDAEKRCNNNYECKTNICIEGTCIDPEEYKKNLICAINPEAYICD